MVEHAAVNRRVVGSSPTRGARVPINNRDYLFCVIFSLHTAIRTDRNILQGFVKRPQTKIVLSQYDGERVYCPVSPVEISFYEKLFK